MDSAAREAIVDTLLDMRKLLAKSRSDLEQLGEEALAKLHEKFDEHVDRLGGLIPGATPPSRIEDFFTQVGEGMVAAQADLDRQSFAYNARRPDGALPSTYRIPKVQAEIGFTMSRKRAKQFGVFALGRSASGEKRNSNSVSFEIVSVPPSTELLDQIPTGAHFVTRLSEREEVRTALASAVADTAVAAGTAAAMLADFNRVLVFAGQDEWLLAHVVLVDGTVPATTQFGVLREGAPSRFTSHGPVPASQADQGRWVQLRDFLNGIAATQARALGAFEAEGEG